MVAFRMDLETRTLAPRKTLELHKEGISDIALRPDDKIFATAGWDCRVRLYSYKKAAPLAILKASCSGLKSRPTLQINADFSTQCNCQLQLVDDIECVPQYHTAAVTTMAFSAAHLLASAARDGCIALWSVYRDDQ